MAMILNSTDLQYFVEIAHTLNLSSAAIKLGVSQPSLSLAIQRMESQTKVRLFLRSKKGVSLTPAGRELLANAHCLLEHWGQVQEKLSVSHTEARGRFIVGAHPSVALYTFPQTMSDLLVHNPGLEVSFVHDLSRKVLDFLISVKIDIAVVVNPVRHPDLIIRKVCEDEVTFWYKPGMKENASVLIYDPDMLQAQNLIRKAKRQGHEFKRHIHSSNLEVISGLAHGGAGIAILPTRVANPLNGRPLEKMKNAPVYNDEICIVYRAESRTVRAIQIIADMIEKALTK